MEMLKYCNPAKIAYYYCYYSLTMFVLLGDFRPDNIIFDQPIAKLITSFIYPPLACKCMLGIYAMLIVIGHI